MKRTVFLFTIILMISSSYFIQHINAQWIRQVSGSTNNIRDVYFLNLNTGWACGDTKIYKTTNGGVNWVEQSNPAQSYISQIHAVDSNIVFAAGWFTILKSTNGGTNWIGIMTGTFGSGLPVFEGLYFLNANTGWFCGSLQIWKTTNGGLTFDSVYISAELTDIYFKNELEGVSTGEYTTRWTSDGGQNWITGIMKDELRQIFNRVSFINNYTGFVVGSGGNTFRTTDFGITWDSIGYLVTDQNIYGSIFTSQYTGYAGGSYGVFYKTTNGGQSWGFQDTNNLGRGFIKSFWGYNDSILWAVGGGGKILHTTTGGQWLVGINNIATEIPKSFILNQNYPNPFNNSTIIEFSVNKSGNYKLEVFDVTGKVVSTLLDRRMSIGNYKINFNSGNISSGIYFYRLKNEDNLLTKRFIVIK